jgi:hypothetical protein
MLLYGELGEVQVLGYLGVCQPVGDVSQDLSLTHGQGAGIYELLIY